MYKVLLLVLLCVLWPWASRGGNPITQPAPLPDSMAGFRLETEPKIQPVFGDVVQYKRHVDRFFALHQDMETTRGEFSRYMQAALSLVGQPWAPESALCSNDNMAKSYGHILRLAQKYQHLGEALEAQYAVIHRLDAWEETKSLPPAYRLKVARALKAYSSLLTDFREIKLQQTQLTDELTAHGCDPQALKTLGEALAKNGKNHTLPASPPGNGRTKVEKPAKSQNAAPKEGQPATLSASVNAVTFFVDNSLCKNVVRVYLDGSLLGEIHAQAKGAYTTLGGWHELCLISPSQPTPCGAQGTVRKAYIHDGWTIMFQCE